MAWHPDSSRWPRRNFGPQGVSEVFGWQIVTWLSGVVLWCLMRPGTGTVFTGLQFEGCTALHSVHFVRSSRMRVPVQTSWLGIPDCAQRSKDHLTSLTLEPKVRDHTHPTVGHLYTTSTMGRAIATHHALWLFLHINQCQSIWFTDSHTVHVRYCWWCILSAQGGCRRFKGRKSWVVESRGQQSKPLTERHGVGVSAVGVHAVLIGCTAGPMDWTDGGLHCMQPSPGAELLAAHSMAKRAIFPAIGLSVLFICWSMHLSILSTLSVSSISSILSILSFLSKLILSILSYLVYLILSILSYLSDLFYLSYLSFLIYLSIYLSIYLCIYLSICLFIYLSTYLSAYLSTYLPIYLSAYLPIGLSAYLPTYCLSTYHGELLK